MTPQCYGGDMKLDEVYEAADLITCLNTVTKSNASTLTSRAEPHQLILLILQSTEG